MARGINKVILIGRLGADPETRYTASGLAIANISVATNRVWKNRDNNDQEQTEWHKVVLFDKLAEVAGEYLRKGREVYIEGRLQTRKWQDQNGQDRWSTEIVANDMQMLGGRGDDAPARSAPDSFRENAAPSRQGPAKASEQSPAPQGEDNFTDDDIPF